MNGNGPRDESGPALQIEDARPDRDLHPTWDLQEFFEFGRHGRRFTTSTLLHDCHLTDVYISHYVTGWPTQGPPHPETFTQFFPSLVRKLVPTGSRLTLSIRGIDRDHLDELLVVNQVLVPHRVPYALVSQSGPGNRDPHLPAEGVGQLFFEWPLNELAFVVDNWFEGFTISIEGYISDQMILANLAELYFQPDSEARIRNLLRIVRLGFKVWSDNNGLFILSEQQGSRELAESLDVGELNAEIRRSVARDPNDD